MRRLAAALTALTLLAAAPVCGQGTLVRGEASLVAVASNASEANRQLAVRFIPEFGTGFRLSGGWAFDGAVAATATAGASYFSGRQVSSSRDVGLHRAWVRLSSPRFELRAGLQKISFGSSSLFRPLMWFDRVDPRDPTQYSEGVYALLARYASARNHSLWAWALYGNDDARGWDTWGTRPRTPEFGGRGQLALPRGEVAATYHRRRASVGLPPSALLGATPGLSAAAPVVGAPTPGTQAALVSAPEDRIGADAKFDIGPGVWLEAAYTRTDSAAVRRRWQPAFSVGIDYTFGIGNGLTLLAEHFQLDPSVPVGTGRSQVKLSALTGTYPLGAADSLSGIVYYEWNREDVFRFVEWRRTWDHWRLHVIGFWNPSRASVFSARAQTSALTGRGAELAVVASY